MKKSSLNGAFPVAGTAVDRYTREANAQIFNAAGMGYDNSDPNFYATGAVQSSQSPYTVTVSNSGLTDQTAILFGGFKYLNVSRFGSGADVTISLENGVSYAQLVQQSISEPFEITLTRIECTDAVQLKKPMLLNTQDATGDSSSKPITVSSYVSPEQFQNNFIDVAYAYRIDGSKWISYSIGAGKTVVFNFFVAAKVNTARPLVGQAPITEFSTQDVRTFTK